jgi:ABC-type multidrug transport system fused ATPase/permease subunit
MISILDVERPYVAPEQPAEEPPHPSPLRDERSGLEVRAGELVCVVSASADDAAALADRLGGFGDGDGVTLGGVPLSQLATATLRRRILVAEPDPVLFAGTLRRELDPWGRADDDRILEAVAVANAEDVLEALPDGLDETVEERGRSFSGGQRQRLVLARALLADPEVLVLVEPTSAVDAHTEARIARRLRDARADRATVVATASPLVLDLADRVVLLAEGRVAAEGSHRELLARGDYRDVVTRGEDE